MKRGFLFAAVTVLTGCSLLQGTPQPPPPATDTPQEIARNQTNGLQRLGSVSAMVRGSPSDGEAAIKAKATAAKADYYHIILNDEAVTPGIWYIQAQLFRQ